MIVIPAKAGIRRLHGFDAPESEMQRHWIPAFAGMTDER